jgi:hypothetical protein
VVVLGIVVICTIAFTVHNAADRQVAAARATSTASPMASRTKVPPATGVPAPTGTPRPSSTVAPASTRTPLPSSTPAPIATSTSIPTSTPAPSSTSTALPFGTPMSTSTSRIVPAYTNLSTIVPTIPSLQPSDSPDQTTAAAIILATMQLGYTPPADNPTVRAFALDLTALQPICKIGMVPLAYQVANASAVLQNSGASASLLDTASRLREFVTHMVPGDRIVIGSCPGLFDAYTRSLVDTQGGQGGQGDNGNPGGSDKHGKKGKHGNG